MEDQTQKKNVLLSAKGICENASPFSLKLPRCAEMKFKKKIVNVSKAIAFQMSKSECEFFFKELSSIL